MNQWKTRRNVVCASSIETSTGGAVTEVPAFALRHDVRRVGEALTGWPAWRAHVSGPGLRADAVHAAADDPPPFTEEQRDRLRNIFAPAVRRIHTGDAS
jgi:hypothetical protein